MEEEKNFLKFFSVCRPNEIPKSSSGLPPPSISKEVSKVLALSEAEPVPKKAKNKAPKKPKAPPASYQISTIQDYSMDIHKQRDHMFMKRLQETGRIADANVRKLPAMVDVLNFISKIPNQPLWFKASQHAIVNAKTLKFPDMDVLTRAFIREYMRVPLDKEEQACQNQTCESEVRHGFRLRVLGIKNNYWCFLCHLFHTNRLFLESLNRKQDTDRVYQIHFFMVQVEIPGEYRLDQTLIGDKDVRGLFGPFPIYNVNNYHPVTFPNGCKGLEESDKMVFRLPQTAPRPSSNPTECCSTTPREMANTSSQSNLIKSRLLH